MKVVEGGLRGCKVVVVIRVPWKRVRVNRSNRNRQQTHDGVWWTQSIYYLCQNIMYWIVCTKMYRKKNILQNFNLRTQLVGAVKFIII